MEIWTDTHYKLAPSDALAIATCDREGSAALALPGSARNDAGFCIHFTSARVEILEQLVRVLREMGDRSPGSQPEIFCPKGRANDELFACRETP